jgi:hypothetical protein
MKLNLEISDSTLILLALIAIVFIVLRHAQPSGAGFLQQLDTFADQFSTGNWPGNLPTTTTIE